MKKIKNSSYSHNTKKAVFLFTVIELISFGIQAAPGAPCRVAVTSCDVQNMINSHIGLQPGNPIPASVAVSVGIRGISNFQPSALNGPANYSGSTTLILTTYNGTAAAIDVSCVTTAPSALSYNGYSGAKITSATNVALTPTPTGAATPPALRIATASAGTTSTVSATTTAVTSFTPANLWGVSMGGQYLCTITPVDTSYSASTQLVPVNVDA